MIIAVTYDSASGTIFQHFGKTRQFKIFEVENNQVSKSYIADADGFSHEGLTVFLKNLNVDTLILGNRGQGAIDALNAANIKQYPGVTGDPDKAVDELLKGTLVFNENAKCNHHGEHDHGEQHHSLPVINLNK